jgi:NADPH-dependent 7-cyano-7-deazaguanine reductase QueF
MRKINYFREELANNFRKELIELLTKHNAEISIDSDSGGSIDLNFDIKDSKGEFIVSDSWLASTTNSIITVKDIERTIQLEF